MRLKFIYYIFFILFAVEAFAGNPERVGQAGATQLLINPYARSSGLNGMNVATVTGIESVINNPAGLAYTRATEVVFSHTQWLSGAGISINTLGLSQKLGENGGVVGLSVVAFSFGDIPITTVDNPEGGLGTYSPTYINMGLSYGRMMVQDRIYVGFTIKLIHESIQNVAANGVAFDAGVQYKTRDGRFRLGVALRNIGPAMKFSGDGLTLRADLGGTGSAFTSAVSNKPSNFQMPSVLHIGAAYEFRFGKETSRYKIRKEISRKDTIVKKVDSLSVWDHKVVPMFTFTSNTFSRDLLGLGVEYRFRDMLMIRAAYLYEQNIFKSDSRSNASSGLAVGGSFEFPFSMKDPKTGQKSKTMTTLAIDYSYRHTFYFNGTHSIGLRLNL